ncbi:peroxiredoxin [Sulfodiicoccus acidiphilus]|uniref:Peroxiredoxin n=1 Tax=Sulfodiicoccus acidiphilus TaxID=1670455 RepID=A0A348B2Z1_9CREN|nr:DsrE/DsrF/DrsH-like family protein [Sulfodiicoccus acidiphilus]BBD72543.1 peroxiredoxin [Sulfodiicoccus acidiphilus]GGT93789.1 peroxiredoxin [Sulfodiicoccus acidiphilus]
MSKLTLLLADNALDKLYHGLVMALDAKTMGWTVKFFVTSQAIVLFTKKSQGKGRMKMGTLARLYVNYSMKRLGLSSAQDMLKEALQEGVEFYVDEIGLKMVGFSKEDIMDGVKLSGGVSFLQEARDSDVVVTL